MKNAAFITEQPELKLKSRTNSPKKDSEISEPIDPEILALREKLRENYEKYQKNINFFSKRKEDLENNENFPSNFLTKNSYFNHNLRTQSLRKDLLLAQLSYTLPAASQKNPQYQILFNEAYKNKTTQISPNPNMAIFMKKKIWKKVKKLENLVNKINLKDNEKIFKTQECIVQNLVYQKNLLHTIESTKFYDENQQNESKIEIETFASNDILYDNLFVFSFYLLLNKRGINIIYFFYSLKKNWKKIFHF